VGGGKNMGDLKVYYDPEIDVLYIAREGIEEEVIEVSPGINLEIDDKGEVIGVEILEASRLLRDVISQISKRTQIAVGY